MPRLALRRTPADELVIAPYATALAAQIAPRRAAATCVRLQALGARGALRLHRGARLHAGAAGRQRRLHAGGHLHGAPPGHEHRGAGQCAAGRRRAALGHGQRRTSRRVASLLHERAPREVSRAARGRGRPAAAGARTPRAGPAARGAARRRTRWSRRTCCPTAATAWRCAPTAPGWSRWGATGITRWRDDALRDAYGSFFYLRWTAARTDAPVLASTAAPGARPGRALPQHASTPTACASTPPGPSCRRTPRSGSARRTTSSSARSSCSNLGERDARDRADVGLRGDAGRRARRRGPPGVHRTCSCAPTGSRRSRRCVRAQAAAAHRSRAAGGALPGRQPRRRSWAARARPTASAGSAATASQPAAGRLRCARAGQRRAAGAGHRPRPGVRAGRAAAHRAARQGAPDLRHRGHRQRRHAARGDRQVPPAQPCAARLADVGHADRHPAAHAAHQRRELRRDADADHGAGAEPDAAAHRHGPMATRRGARSATAACCGASASRATGRSCWCRPARCRAWACCARWRRRCACGPGAASPATWWWSTPKPRPTRWRCSAMIALRDRHGADSAAQPGPAATALHVLRADELSADELTTLRAWRACTCTPTAARCCTMCRPGSRRTSRRWSGASSVSTTAAADTADTRRRSRPHRRASSRPRPASSASTSARRSGRRGRGSTCWPTRASAPRSPKPAAATPGPSTAA